MGTKGIGSTGYRMGTASAMDTHNYNSSGESEKSYMENRSNYLDVLNDVENSKYVDEIKEAVTYWTEGWLSHPARYNENEWENLGDYASKIELLDKMIDRAYFNDNVIISRYASGQFITNKFNSSSEQIMATLDRQIKDKEVLLATGQLSGAYAAEGLSIEPPWNKSKNVEYKYYIPKNTKGVGMWIADERIGNNWGTKQLEAIINRNTAWRPTKYTYNKEKDIVTAHMQYVGSLPHTYPTGEKYRNIFK